MSLNHSVSTLVDHSAFELKDRYSTSETWNVKDVVKLKPLQVRDEEDVDHIKQIDNSER